MRWRLCRETTVTTWLRWGDWEAGMPPGGRETELIIVGRARTNLDSRNKHQDERTHCSSERARWRGEGNETTGTAGSHWEDDAWYLLELRHNPAWGSWVTEGLKQKNDMFTTAFLQPDRTQLRKQVLSSESLITLPTMQVTTMEPLRAPIPGFLILKSLCLSPHHAASLVSSHKCKVWKYLSFFLF